MAHTVASLLAIWTSLVDELFSQPFTDAGEGGGLEVWTQAMAQLARVSEAIERTAASLYLQPSSAPGAPSAQGGEYATVDVVVERTREFQFPLYMDTQFVLGEVGVQPSVEGGVEVLTGREYHLVSGIGLFPGEPGPVTVQARAMAMGSGYNYPLAGSITAVVQPAADAAGVGATVVMGAGLGDWLYSANAQGSFIANHLGQYVQLLSGDNAGKLRRVVGYVPPGLTPLEHGGAVTLAHDVVVNVDNVVGDFTPGNMVEWGLGKGKLLAFNGQAMLIQREQGYFAPGTITAGTASADLVGVHTQGMLIAIEIDIGLFPSAWFPGDVVTQAGTGAVGNFVCQEDAWVLLAPVAGSFDTVGALTGSLSGYVGVPLGGIGYDPRLVPGGAVEWKVVDWADELGVVANNPLPPMGGRFAVLDELMRDRGIIRGVGESDASLLRRGVLPADVVSPNAIRRTIARHYGSDDWEFKEVGTPGFPGFFYDVPVSASPGYACAYDMTATNTRFGTVLGYDEFRAFFLIGLPTTGEGEFGFAYDDGPANAWDVGAFDGYPVVECSLRKRLWDDIVGRKASGVGFDFYAK